MKNRSHRYDINRPRSRHGKRELEMLPKAFIFTMLLSKKQKKNEILFRRNIWDFLQATNNKVKLLEANYDFKYQQANIKPLVTRILRLSTKVIFILIKW